MRITRLLASVLVTRTNVRMTETFTSRPGNLGIHGHRGNRQELVKPDTLGQEFGRIGRFGKGCVGGCG
jgi:hypothetical protein